MQTTQRIRAPSASANPQLLDLVGRDTRLRWKAHTCGGEWHGACPRCGGKDRMRVQPRATPKPRCSCRNCHGNRWLDAPGYLMWLYGLSYADARTTLGMPQDNEARPSEPLPPDDGQAPPDAWQHAAERLTDACQRALWSTVGSQALIYLRRRGLMDQIIRTARLGYNAGGRHSPFATWGLPDDARRQGVWLQRGIVIPWRVDGAIWKLQIRSPGGAYHTVLGSANTLYNVDALQVGQPAILVEGAFDALVVAQAASDLGAAVACGTSGARRMRWITRLALCSEVLIALDNEDDRNREVARASAYWRAVLAPRARRWRPYLKDCGAMAEHHMDLRAWVASGLATHGGLHDPVRH